MRHRLQLPTSLSGKLLLGLGAGMLLSSLVFLVLFVNSYHARLTAERGSASEQVNRLFHVALQNAMLKRDLPGLEDIIAKLGAEPGIERVMIVNPGSEVRFASPREVRGRMLTLADLGCGGCKADFSDLPRATWATRDEKGLEILRSVHPIRNQTECQGCHGEIAKSPVNGVLVVDHAVAELRAEAEHAAAGMTLAGVSVVLTALGGVWAFMHRTVVSPLKRLEAASQKLATGDLAVRLPEVTGAGDEIGSLTRTFNVMAESLARNHAELQESEAFLQGLIDTVPDAVRVIGEDYSVVLVNRAYTELIGKTPGEAVGKPCYLARGRTEPCPVTLVTCPLAAITADTPRIRYMHEIVTANGAQRFVELTASRHVVSSKGQPRTLVIEAMRDLDQQIKFSHEQSLSEIGQLATGVAHEIYNPLASVRLGLQALDKRLSLASGVDAETASFLAIVNGQVDRCIEVTKRLLDLGSPPSTSLQLVSFSTIVPEVMSLLSFDAGRRGIDCRLDVAGHDLRVLATDSEMRMLALNLAQNAFHAMPHGGRLAICGRSDGREVTLQFIDTGTGIAPDDLKRIFDPFFSKRADGSTGSGLGLTICRAIAGRYHGALEVASKAGEGTVFTVRMPAAAAAAEGAA